MLRTAENILEQTRLESHYGFIFWCYAQLGTLAYFDFDYLYVWLCSKGPSNPIKLWPEAL